MYNNCAMEKMNKAKVNEFLFKDVRKKTKMTRRELSRVIRRAHLLELNVYGIEVENKRGDVVGVFYQTTPDKFWYLEALSYIKNRKFYEDKLFVITYGTDEDLERMTQEVERELEGLI